MVGQLRLETLVNGKPVTYAGLRDPFNLNMFPGAVDISRGRTLDRLGKDISYVTRQLALQDPDVTDVKVTYTIEKGDLIVTTTQSSNRPYEMLEYEAALDGTFYSPQPKLHSLRATLAVLHGKNQPYLNRQSIAFDIISQWRGMRGGRANGGGGSGSPVSFGQGLAGLAYGLSFWGGSLVV